MNDSASHLSAPSQSPWAWFGPVSAWADDVARRAPALIADASMLDVERVRSVLVASCNSGERWLLHPLFRAGAGAPLEVTRAVFIAAHCDEDVGRLRVSGSAWVWAPDGGFAVPAGEHDLRELGARWRAATGPTPIAIDVWSEAGAPADGDGWESLDADDSRRRDVAPMVVAFLGSALRLKAHLPRINAWVTSVTQVVVPFVPLASSKEFRSASHPDVPGIVWLDVTPNVLTTLEALVHESAHHHLFLCERSTPLVAPGDDNRYPSPLRTDLRPLRGILMAYHALVYIAAMFVDTLNRSFPGDRPVIDAQLHDTIERARDAESTLFANRDGLTVAGRSFLERTRELARYAGV